MNSMYGSNPGGIYGSLPGVYGSMPAATTGAVDGGVERMVVPGETTYHPVQQTVMT
eukprot:CAMPEP_0173434176 /NCGR_PEP_ID=MMETSP1357-20121228/12173_1 /TAXON_ID=77926 /ORGANISM="Hemiselmis rufescens, Strain PCC563" /LENGTH=55 /DNA_ID=CAMNT_0014398987 /DNA_START=28 /DNA_END=192 /DNA_ORIENTATION=+